MIPTNDKEMLHRYLHMGREAIVWKLDGVSEYDIRRPMTPTGTNLLGIVKHLAIVEFGYFGDVFGRPHGVSLPGADGEYEPNEDMYATADESRTDILGLYAQANDHADVTIRDLPLDAEGHVPWWGDANPVTLHWILTHMIAETNRHAGHADILREQIDGAAGHRPGVDNLPDVDPDWWPAYVERVDAEARRASERPD